MHPHTEPASYFDMWLARVRLSNDILQAFQRLSGGLRNVFERPSKYFLFRARYLIHCKQVFFNCPGCPGIFSAAERYVFHCNCTAVENTCAKTNWYFFHCNDAVEKIPLQFYCCIYSTAAVKGISCQHRDYVSTEIMSAQDSVSTEIMPAQRLRQHRDYVSTESNALF